MTDIVERLRKPIVSDDAFQTCERLRAERREAADEIERLRTALEDIAFGVSALCQGLGDYEPKVKKTDRCQAANSTPRRK